MRNRCVADSTFALSPLTRGVCAVLFAASVWAPGVHAAAQPPSPSGDSEMPPSVVARLAVGAPSAREFVLRGTIPVPRGTFPRADGRSPFRIRDVDGTLAPTQTEVVSRYADEASGADVIEVLARVQKPIDPPPGAMLHYDVVASPHDPGEFVRNDQIDEVLQASSPLRLTARDVFGNRYTAELTGGNSSVGSLRDGVACQEWRTLASFLPDNPHPGPHGTLPHLMSVHAFFRIWTGEPVVSLDLVIHNGVDGHDPSTNRDDPVGTIYFDSIDLWLPGGWVARQDHPDSFTGDPTEHPNYTRVPLVKPLEDGKLHVMPIQCQTLRRIALSPSADVERAVDYVRDANLGFARRGINGQGQELYSWWNPVTPGFFPQKHVLPRLDYVSAASIITELDGDYAVKAYALRSGTATGYPILSPALGWAHPWGIEDGGMAGGDEIYLYEGLRTLEVASQKGYRTLAMRLRMLTDRQPVALYDEDGRPADYTRWTVQGQSGTWLPIWCFLRPLLWAADPFGFTSAPTFQVDAVTAQGRKPDYEDALRRHDPIDLEHLVRYTAPAKALAWIGNDTLAKEALALHAELFRMSYNEMPNSDYGHWIPTGLGSDENYVAANPGIGFTFGRMEAWGLDAATAWYALAPRGWRASTRDWFARVADVVGAGQSQCSGFIEAMIYEQLFDGHYRARQSIEQAITEHALFGLANTVFTEADPARDRALHDVLMDSFRAMVTPPGWSELHNAPWAKLAVGDANFSHDPFCGPPPADGYADGGDEWQVWSSFAYAYERTEEDIFLQRAKEMLGTNDLLQGLQAQGLWNLGNRAALLALAQQLDRP